MVITDSCNGTNAGQVREPQRKKLDERNSGIWAGSTFARLDQEGTPVGQPKDTDDKIVVGYAYDGLPFQIVVDGFFGCSKERVFNFIDEHVTPLMDGYANDLSNPANTPETITKALIRAIRSKRNEFMATSTDFTMSIAMTYEREEQLYCSGFGIGDTGIAIKRADTGQVEQLVTNNEVNGFKDAFDDYCSEQTLEKILAKNTLFTTEITSDDEIVGYTYVHDEMEEVSEEFRVEEDHVRQKKLQIQQLDRQSLFDYLLAENARIQQQKLERDNAGQQWGDDTTIGQIIIPQPALHNKRRTMATLHSTINRIENRNLKEKTQNVYDRANDLIEEGRNIDEVIEHVQLTNQLLHSQTGEELERLSTQYKQAARRVQGKPSLGWRLLGGQ